MKNLLLLAIAMTLGACSGDDGGSTIECSGSAYDPCVDNADCDSQNCHLYGSAAFTVCTQACDASNPCPDQDGEAVPCNNMGLCRPAAANTCTAP